jgi:hypothetical protein
MVTLLTRDTRGDVEARDVEWKDLDSWAVGVRGSERMVSLYIDLRLVGERSRAVELPMTLPTN